MPRKDTTKVKKRLVEKRKLTPEEKIAALKAQVDAKREAERKKKKQELQFRSSIPLDVSPEPRMRR
tara:strand:- start:1962 stop:2159 length:198 start_codon:yes stop_codon:yes gene_type:complete